MRAIATQVVGRRVSVPEGEEEFYDSEPCFGTSTEGVEPPESDCHWDVDAFGLLKLPKLGLGYVLFGGQTTGLGLGGVLSVDLISTPRHAFSASAAAGLVWGQLAVAYSYALAPGLRVSVSPSAGGALDQWMVGAALGLSYALEPFALMLEAGWSHRWDDVDSEVLDYRYHAPYLSLALLFLFPGEGD